MGYDQEAYLDIDDQHIQDEITKFIKENNLDTEKYEAMKIIGCEFGNRYCDDKHLGWIYIYNENCNMHEIHCSHCSNFIRDDERFTNPRYQRMLCKRLGKEAFPRCLEYICWNLRTRNDAIEIADALAEFFADDRDLLQFADWLRSTAKCCSTYELSY